MYDEYVSLRVLLRFFFPSAGAVFLPASDGLATVVFVAGALEAVVVLVALGGMVNEVIGLKIKRWWLGVDEDMKMEWTVDGCDVGDCCC